MFNGLIWLSITFCWVVTINAFNQTNNATHINNRYSNGLKLESILLKIKQLKLDNDNLETNLNNSLSKSRIDLTDEDAFSNNLTSTSILSNLSHIFKIDHNNKTIQDFVSSVTQLNLNSSQITSNDKNQLPVEETTEVTNASSSLNQRKSYALNYTIYIVKMDSNTNIDNIEFELEPLLKHAILKHFEFKLKDIECKILEKK